MTICRNRVKRIALGLLGTLLAFPLAACTVSQVEHEQAAAIDAPLTSVDQSTRPDRTKGRAVVSKHISGTQQHREVGDPTEPDPSPWTESTGGTGGEPDPSPWTGGSGSNNNDDDPNHPAFSKDPAP